MTDELDARIRALEAERLRPVPPRPPRRIHPRDLAELCELLGDEDDTADAAGVEAGGHRPEEV